MMPLEKYKEMRDFSKTPEPEAEVVDVEPFFVVQEHHASRLHYDFRLLMDGVLKSWAVPRGVPAEPGVKRLAVQTEDHPVSYGSFEGMIPEGEYGAGKVIIWDKGGLEIQERQKDKLVFKLDGKKIKGTYALVRFKGKEQNEDDWLLMKVPGEHKHSK